MLMQKNAAQEEAIQTIYGRLLLISCPGSGKTTTMLRRINHMIDQGIDPSSILMVTFTEAAAKEMKNRFSYGYGDAPVTFCTIHALCVRIIHAAGIHNMHIMDASETDSILRSAAASIGQFFEDFKNIKNDIGLFKNTGSCKKRSEASLNEGQFRSFYKAYEQAKESNQALDFDDLLILGRKILSENPTVLSQFQNRFRFLICDEYQDTNPIQKDILYLLSAKYGNLCVVGDDDQSIYGFRGAVPSLMLSFEKDFPDCKVIHMDINYRSVPGILEPSSMMIRFNADRFKKNITAFREAREEHPVKYDIAPDRDTEMLRLVDEIKRYHSLGNPYHSCAVLARINAQLEQVAEVFTEHKIPFTSKDVVRDVYEHWSFSDICTYLKLAEGNGTIKDFIRIVNRPKRYVKVGVFSNLPYDQDKILAAAANTSSYVLDNLTDYFWNMKKLSELPFDERIPFILKELGYERYIESYADQTGADHVSLDAKCSIFQKDAAKCGSLGAWIAYAKKHCKNFHDTLKTHNTDGVLLATMHRSKGLEWDHVFLIDCCEKMVPYERKDCPCDI